VPVPALSAGNPTHLPALHDPRYSFFAMLSRSSEPCVTRLRIGTLADGCRWLSRGLAPTSCAPNRQTVNLHRSSGGTFQTPSAAKKKKKKIRFQENCLFCCWPCLCLVRTRLSRPHLFVFALHLPHSSALACSRKCHYACSMHVHILGFLAGLSLLILSPCSAAAAASYSCVI